MDGCLTSDFSPSRGLPARASCTGWTSSRPLSGCPMRVSTIGFMAADSSRCDPARLLDLGPTGGYATGGGEELESADVAIGHACPMAVPMASSKVRSSNGFGRYAATPDRLTRSRVGGLSWAVMKITGMALRSAANRS